MEDIKWLIKKYGLIFLLLVIAVIMSCAIHDKMKKEQMKQIRGRGWEL